MSLFPIFKVNKLINKDDTETIYVFCGSNLDIDIDTDVDIEDLNELFEKDPSNKTFQNIFDKDELDNIRTNKIPVDFLKQTIHIDDSIGIIKLKIFEALRRSVSMSEIYLFCLKDEKLNPITVYQNLTQNDRLPLTKVRLEQIIKNIYDDDGEPIDFELPRKEKYTFDDILNLDLTERKYLIAKNLGQKFIFNNEYPFIANPFYVTEYDALLEHSRRELTSLSNSLLLESFPIFKDTIYLCVAPDVFSLKTDVSMDYMCKIYFPFLYQESINTLEKLDDSRDKLIEETTSRLTPDVEKGFESIDMFYNIFKNKEQSKYFSEKGKNKGIKFIKIIMHPEFQIKIPIDVIFKLIHATKEFPLIKFNPETRQENIYRLYTEQMTADGKKIPFLNKAIIFKLIKNIGKGRSVAVYTNIMFEGNEYLFTCEFSDNGSITIYPLTNFEKVVYMDDNSFDKINSILSLAVNPLIEQIKPFFEQSGLDIPLFTTINSINVEIREIVYQTVYSISKPMDVNNYIGCISSAFTVESANFKQGIEMRFKRVANYNKKDSQEAFIIEKIDQGFKFDEIVEELVQNFNDTNDEMAADLIAKIRTELEITRGSNRRRTLMLKINPGFKTYITLDSILSEITVTVEGINDIFYLYTIPVYIDTLVRITQDMKSTRVDSALINKLCTGSELKDAEFDQITAVSEQNIKGNQVPDIQDESPVYLNSDEYKKGEDMDDLLDILGFEEEEDEPNSNSKGGAKEDSSSEDNDSGSSGKDVKTPSYSSSEKEDSSSDSSKKDVKTPSEKEDSSSESSGKDVKTPSYSSSEDNGSESSGKDVKTPSEKEDSSSESSKKDVKTPSYSSLSDASSLSEESEEPNPNEFDTKKFAAPTSKIDVPSTEEKESTSTQEEEEEEEESSTEEKEEIKEVKPPLVEVEVNINPKEEEKAESSSEDVKNLKIMIPEKVDSSSYSSEEIVIPEKKKKAKTSSQEEEVIVVPKKEKKEKKIEAIKKNMENTVRDITGMKLRYPNPFTAKIETNAPQLFVREKNDKMDVYTRMCPFSLADRRQPVILTKEEKEELIKDHPDINQETDFIEYSTDATDSSKKFYYTCPRFWCMLTNKMVTEQDILDGKCGPKVKKVEDAIIPKTADSIKNDGRYVYQFYDGKERKYPGFHKKKTPSGLCIPCCYNKWSTEEMKSRRDICQGKVNEEESLSVSSSDYEEQLKKDMQNAESYVKGPEKYGPQLGEHRWGYLPIAVQKFLHEVNEDCQVSNMNTSLKPNHTCILRHGVEVNSQQSFIACIASAMFYAQKNGPNKRDPPLITKFIPNAKNEVPSIEDMKNKIIIPAIDIDKFIKYQNGDLMTSFANPEAEVDIDKPEYKNSKLYKKIKEDKEEEEEEYQSKRLEFFTRAVQAYENFLSFLKDPKIYIDYTYLWDLICMPNPKLFEKGVNLIILEMPEDDITNNIELVCPTNRYSAHIYDTRKHSIILIKRENYFEPVYGYHNNSDKNELYVTTTFTEYDRYMPKTLKAVFTKIIKRTLGERCKAPPNNPENKNKNKNKFISPPLLDILINDLIDKNYNIETQVLNFQGKVIGLQVRTPPNTNKEGFIPCFPSSLTTLKNSKKYGKKTCDIETKCDFDFTYVSDKIWKSYEETLDFLKIYYNYKDADFDPEPNLDKTIHFYRVVNNQLIIGFLTNTNQFIRILDPIPVSSVDDNIHDITNNDMLVADMETLTTLDVDTKRTDFIKRIQLETNFYNVFRNTIRILFNDYSNSEKRKSIQSECNKRFGLYRQQINTVVDMLHELVGDSIIFSTEEDGFNYKKIDENEIHNCIKLSKDKCEDKSEESFNICQMTNDTCTLVLPKNNLITDTDNEEFYYGRMADELIRYNRIKSFIFKPQAYLSFGQIKFNLRDNEMLILQDLLTQEFFENLIPADINKYAKYNTYDTAKPITNITHKREFELDEVINPNHERDCFPSESASIKSRVWKPCFPSNYKEIAYSGNSKFCALYMIIDLLKKVKGITDYTVEKIKEDLVDEYNILTNNNKNENVVNKIIHILKEEGQYDANQLLEGTMNFEQMIMHDGFGAVNFDLWLLLVKYEIPSIFISSKEIPETRFNRKAFVCYKDSKTNGNFVFIVTPAMYIKKRLKNPEYRLILNENLEEIISIKALKDDGECLQNIEEAIEIAYSVTKYIEDVFEKDNTTKYNKRQKDIRRLDYDIVSELNDTSEDEDEDEGSEYSDSSDSSETRKTSKKKVIKLKKGRNLKQTIILEEEPEEEEQRPTELSVLDTDEFEIELPPTPEAKKKKNKKKSKRKYKIIANPPQNQNQRKTKKNNSF